MRKRTVCVIAVAAALVTVALTAKDAAIFSVLKSMAPLGKQAGGT